MTSDEDFEKFAYYFDGPIESLREIEGWSDSKIAYWLRDKAKELAPRKRTTKFTKEQLIQALEKAHGKELVAEAMKEMRVRK